MVHGLLSIPQMLGPDDQRHRIVLIASVPLRKAPSAEVRYAK
jgi:hypothetical protein